MKIIKLLSLAAFLFSINCKAQIPVANFSFYPNPACQGSNVVVMDLSTNLPSSWSYTLAGATPSLSTIKNPITTYNTAGIYTITLVSSNGSGSSIPVVKTITITPPAISPAITGPCQNTCASTTTLYANPPAIGTGTWSLFTGSGAITSPNQPTTGVSAISTGTNVFLWSIINPGCISTATTCIIRSLTPTPSFAGSSQTICASIATLAGNTPIVGNGTWSLISGSGTIASPNSPNSSISGLGVGTNIFQWSISNGACPPSTSTVAIVVSAMPNAIITTVSQTICSSTATLVASTPSVGTGVWTLLSGSGAITSPNSPTTGVTGISTGTNTFQWTVTNGACVATATATIQRYPSPTVSNAGISQTICVSTGSAVVIGNTPAIGIGTWSVVSGSGTITSPTSPTTSVTGLSIGTTILQWSIISGCSPASTSTLAIVVKDMPSISNAGPSQTICATSSTLNANTPLVGTGVWSLISGTASIATPSSPTSGVGGLAIGMHVFQWTISNGVCASSTSTVAIYVSPCAGIEPSQVATNSYGVFPNPTNGEIIVSLKTLNENTYVEVYNTLGQLILTKAATETNVKLNLSEFSEGVYHIKIANEGKQLYQTKVIKD